MSHLGMIKMFSLFKSCMWEKKSFHCDYWYNYYWMVSFLIVSIHIAIIVSMFLFWNLSKTTKNVKILKMYPSSTIRDYQNLWREIRNCKDSKVTLTCVQLNKLLLKHLVILDSRQFWKIMSTCVSKVGCPLWLCGTFLLNSKMVSFHIRIFNRVTIKRS